MINGIDLKRLENGFRYHGIETEDAFYAISSEYINYYEIPISSRLKKISSKGNKISNIYSNDQRLTNELMDLVRLDPNGEMLPKIYQFFLAKRFRDTSGKFFTPHTIAHAMAALLPIKENAIVMDPTSGGGTFLIETSKRWKTSGCQLIGNDIDDMLIDLTELILSLTTPKNHARHLYVSNIYSPSSDIRKLFNNVDYILANPPFSLAIDTFDSASKLFSLGYRNSDALFIDLAQKLLKPGGRIVCLLPHSISSNNDYSKLRKAVEEDWYLMGIIILPEGVFQLTSNTTTRADIVLLMKKGSDNPPKKSIFCNASSVGVPLSSRKSDPSKNDLNDIILNQNIIEALGL